MTRDIETERLLLAEADEDVIDARLIGWLNDKNLMRWSEQRYLEHSTHSQEAFLKRARIWQNPLCFDIHLIEHPDGPESERVYTLIGSIHADVAKHHKRADLSIMLGPEYHGHGYALEAWLAVEKWLVMQHGIKKFEAGYVRDNSAMASLLFRANYIIEGHRLEHFIIDGEKHELILAGKFMP